MKRQRILPTAIGFVLLAIALPLALTTRAKETPVPERNRVQRVEVASVQETDAATTLRFSGTLQAVHSAGLSFSVGGRIRSRAVDLGDRVEKGQIVARLDSRKLTNGASAAASVVAELKARLSQMERERLRVERLAAASAATDEELEQARTVETALQASLEAGRAGLREARRRVSEAALAAPFAGTVSRVLVEAGEYVSAGTTVVELSGDGALELEVGIPEGLLEQLREGESVTLELPLANGLQVPGTIRSVGRVATGSGRLFPLVISVGDDPRLAAGMTAEVVLSRSDQASLSVPLIAVVNPGGSRPAVFRLANGLHEPPSGENPHVEKVLVTVNRLVGDRVMVNGALAAGDQVVVRGHGGLLDGEAVEVLR